MAYDIDTTGQMVTAREALFWESEMAELEAAARGQLVASAGDQAVKASVESRSSILLLLKLIGLATLAAAAIFLLPRSALRYSRVLLDACFLLAIWIWSKAQSRKDKKVLTEEGKLPPPPVEPS